MYSAFVAFTATIFSAAPPAAQAFATGIAGTFCLSPDGKRLALGCWEIWDVPGRRRLFQGRIRGEHGMAFSPDNKFFAVAGNYSHFHVIDARTGKLHWDLTLEGHGDTVVKHLEFTPGGHLVSSSANGLLRVWDVQGKKPVAMFCFPSRLMYDQAGQDEFLRAWHALAGPKVLPGNVKTFIKFDKKIDWFGNFTLSPDGKAVAVPVGTAEVLLIELATGTILKTLKTGQEATNSVRFSPDGTTLAVGGGGDYFEKPWKGTIELWDVATGKRLRGWKAHRHSVLHMAFSPDGKVLASGGTVDGVRVWNTATGGQLYRLHERPRGDAEDSRSLGVAFLPDGKALLTLEQTDREYDAVVTFWEPATGKRIPQLMGR